MNIWFRLRVWWTVIKVRHSQRQYNRGRKWAADQIELLGIHDAEELVWQHCQTREHFFDRGAMDYMMDYYRSQK